MVVFELILLFLLFCLNFIGAKYLWDHHKEFSGDLICGFIFFVFGCALAALPFVILNIMFELFTK